MSKSDRVREAALQFQIEGEFLEAQPFGSGHINDTYRVMFQSGGESHFHILQRINRNVFKNPDALMYPKPAVAMSFRAVQLPRIR